MNCANNKNKYCYSSRKTCQYCANIEFDKLDAFIKHLREYHCSKEGGSYVCLYGYNNVCSTLPLDGVSDEDYRNHVTQVHVKDRPIVEMEWTIQSANQNLSAVLTDPKKGKQQNFFTRTWGEQFSDNAIVAKSGFYPVEIEQKHFESYRRKVLNKIASKSIQNNAIVPLIPKLPSNDEVPNIFWQADNFIEILKFLSPLNENHNEKIQNLSNYLDLVEIRISEQISTKSEEFFSAIKSNDVITSDICAVCKRIRYLRSKLNFLKNKSTQPILQLLNLKRKQTRLRILLRKLDLISTVMQAQPSLQVLLNTCDYVGALELISGTRFVLQYDLKRILCLHFLNSQFDEMLKLIEKMLNSDLEKLLNTHFQLLLQNLNPSQDFDTDFFISLTTAYLLSPNGFYNGFFTRLKSESFLIIEMLIKQLLINFIAPIDDDFTLNMLLNSESNQILEFNHWFDIIKSLIDSLTDFLDFLQMISKLVRQVLTKNLVEKSETELNNFQLQLDDCLSEICNNCLDRVAVLVKLQLGYQQNSLSETQAISKQIHNLNKFIDYCKNMTNNNASNVLKISIKTQMELHLQKFHHEKKAQLTMLLNNETWKPIQNVPNHFQKLVNQLILNQLNFANFEDTSDVMDRGDFSTTTRFLVVDNEPFTVSSCVLMFLKFTAEYCFRSEQLSILKSVINNKLVDLLRHFNTRISHLILGAEAQKTAGLRTITIQNISITLRSLQLILKVFTFLKNSNRFEKNINVQLNEICLAIQEHINELLNQIATIVTIAIEQSLDPWEAKPPVPSKSFKTIFFHLDKSKEAVFDVLLKEQVCEVFTKIHVSFVKLLKNKLMRMNLINNSAGPKKAQVKLEFDIYMEKLRRLEVVRIDEVANFNDLWN